MLNWYGRKLELLFENLVDQKHFSSRRINKVKFKKVNINKSKMPTSRQMARRSRPFISNSDRLDSSQESRYRGLEEACHKCIRVISHFIYQKNKWLIKCQQAENFIDGLEFKLEKLQEKSQKQKAKIRILKCEIDRLKGELSWRALGSEGNQSAHSDEE